MIYDFAAFSGHWPFRRLRSSGFGAGGGVVSSLDAIFYNDPREGDEPLMQSLPENWQPAVCLNPRLPWMKEALRDYHARGVRFGRLYPCIHDYGPQDPGLHHLCKAASELGITLIVTARMEDDRLCYLLKQHSVSVTEWISLARKYPRVKFVFSHFYAGELSACLPLPGNVWTDTSGLCHGLDPVENLINAGFPAERIVFGSFSPLECRESHLPNLPEHYRDLILSENGQHLLEVSK